MTWECMFAFRLTITRDGDNPPESMESNLHSSFPAEETGVARVTNCPGSPGSEVAGQGFRSLSPWAPASSHVCARAGSVCGGHWLSFTYGCDCQLTFPAARKARRRSHLSGEMAGLREGSKSSTIDCCPLLPIIRRLAQASGRGRRPAPGASGPAGGAGRFVLSASGQVGNFRG